MVAGVRIPRWIRFEGCSIGIFSILLSYMLAQNEAPKRRAEEEWERKQAAAMVERLRSKLPAADPKDMVEALGVWREMTGYLRSAPGGAALGVLLIHKDPAVRREVALLIAEMSRPSDHASSTIEQLMIMLNDRDVDVRVGAFYGLARMAPLGKSAIPKALVGLKDPDPRIRRGAYQVISHWYPFDKEMLPHIVNALEDPDIGPLKGQPGIASVSDLAIHSLRRHDLREQSREGGVKAARTLEKIIKSKKGCDAYENGAISALANVAPDDPAVLQLARQWLQGNTPREWSKGAALVYGLGVHGKDAVPDLIAVLRMKPLDDKKQDEQVKGIAVSALRQIGPAAEAALPALYGLPHTKDAAYLASIVDTIRTLEGRAKR